MVVAVVLVGCVVGVTESENNANMAKLDYNDKGDSWFIIASRSTS